LQGDVLNMARRIVRQVVEEIRRRLETEVRRAFAGRVNRLQHSPLKAARNFDWRGTLRRSLRHYDPRRRRLALAEPRFFAQNTRRLPWTVILCVDQSGSMADSVIHSAVMAGILAGLPLLRLRLVVFDTSVVDLTDRVDDPVEVLMSVQIGGGTDIGKALRYAESIVDQPQRTVVVLVSDFCEGASPGVLMATCRRLRESGVTLLGLASLDTGANAAYDRAMAERLAETGMEIAALTPRHFADWLARVVQSR
jgi:Mg-chelatase subunit ChlD